MLSVFTQPTFPKAAIGLEKDSVTALSLQKEGRRMFGIRQAATLDLPSGLLVPSFLERNIANPSEFAVFLNDAVMSAGLRGQKRWSISLPSNTARSSILTLDSGAAKSESEEILDWKAEQAFGVSASEMRLTRQKISADKSGRPRFFATAVKLSVIDEYESVFESFGWKAGLILPRAVCETKWINDSSFHADTMLISSQSDGFSAILFRSGEPAVVRSVTCRPDERNDEIYRLLMFYNDRLAEESGTKLLDRILLIGSELIPAKIKEISGEAMGRVLQVLRPDEVGFNLPANNLSFDDLAAPAGIASFGWR